MTNNTSTTGQRVTVEHVSKRFEQTQALADVSFSIEPGAFLVFLGPSGSGKTTLLRGISGIEYFDDGTVAFNEDVVDGPHLHIPPERRGLAMVFQDYALWPHLTVLQNVAYALRRERLKKAESRSRTMEILERVGMAQKARAYPQELSGGQQQRIALARALVAKPPLLLFDEPLSNLDANLRERMRVEISTLTRETGSTAIYITHDQSEAFALADVIGVLNEGHLEQFGTPEHIYNHPASDFVARFTGLAGMFNGVLERRLDDDMAVIRIGSHRMPAHAAPGLTQGSSVELAIRPAAPRLVDDAELELRAHDPAQTHDDAAAALNAGELTGTVTDTAYRGRGYEHVVNTDVGELTGIFDTRGRERGSECIVAIDPNSCVAFATQPQQS